MRVQSSFTTAQPGATDILCNTLSASGTIITVPAGRWYTCSISISASVAVLGASNPVVTVNGTGAAPVTGTVVARLNLSGLSTVAVNDAVTIDAVVKAPASNAVTLDFTAGANGTSSATVNGFLYG